MMFHVQFRG